jgi:phosphoadenylyl-sulfate reductase (thioredoxin)
VHLIATARLPIDLFTLDTGVLFRETYQLWWQLERRYAVHIRGVQPRLTLQAQAAVHGPALWTHDPDRCCAIRKVDPLDAERAHLDAWISAIRRNQTPERAGARVVERDQASGLVKVNPLARWTRDEVWDFIREHGVPYNPLHDRGYPSIGCEPCTTAVGEREDPRAGRWRGREKTECGLHLERRAVPATFFVARPEGA